MRTWRCEQAGAFGLPRSGQRTQRSQVETKKAAAVRPDLRSGRPPLPFVSTRTRVRERLTEQTERPDLRAQAQAPSLRSHGQRQVLIQPSHPPALNIPLPNRISRIMPTNRIREELRRDP